MKNNFEIDPVFCLSQLNKNEEIDVIRLDDSDEVLRFSGASAKTLLWIHEGTQISEIKERLVDLSFDSGKVDEFLKDFEAYLISAGILKKKN